MSNSIKRMPIKANNILPEINKKMDANSQYLLI